MRILVVLAVLAACQKTRTVQVLLGPNADTPSAGFLCRQDANPDQLLLQRPDVLSGGEVTAYVVVDVVTLGNKLPGCRGEEIVASCKDGSCAFAEDRTDRYCRKIHFPFSLISQRKELMQSITEQLEGAPITTNAPDGPVLMRAVVSSQDCDDLAANGIDPARAIGCAYSCPALLDDIAGPISLSLDVLTDQCESTVRACAGFGS